MTARAAIILTMALQACTSTPPRPVPRPTAYPRQSIYPAEYVAADSLPIPMLVNTHAARSLHRKADGSVWLTLKYPAYKASIYCTFTPVDQQTAPQVIDNRTERISLNSRDTSPRLWTAQNPAGHTITMVEASGVSTTPLQFISFDTISPRWVVSGTVFLDSLPNDATSDSIRPTIDALRSDLQNMLSSLGK